VATPSAAIRAILTIVFDLLAEATFTQVLFFVPLYFRVKTLHEADGQTDGRTDARAKRVFLEKL